VERVQHREERERGDARVHVPEHPRALPRAHDAAHEIEVPPLDREDAPAAGRREVPDLAEEDREGLGLGQTQVRVGADQPPHALDGVAGAGDGLARHAEQLPHAAVADAEQQLVLVAHVVVDARLREPRAPRELAQRRAREAVRREERFRRLLHGGPSCPPGHGRRVDARAASVNPRGDET
jgi:hypothetical protein